MSDVQIGELVRIFRIGLVSPGLDAETATSCSLCSPRILFGVTRDFFSGAIESGSEWYVARRADTWVRTLLFWGWFPVSGLICCSDGFLLSALGPNFIRAYPVGRLVVDCMFRLGRRSYD